MKNRTEYLIRIDKQQSNYKSEFCYYAVTVSIDGDPKKASIASLEGKDVSVSQYDIAALAYYVNRSRKEISGDGDLVNYKFSFPTERAIYAGKSIAGLSLGLSDEEVANFWKAFNDPNNPDPH